MKYMLYIICNNEIIQYEKILFYEFARVYIIQVIPEFNLKTSTNSQFTLSLTFLHIFFSIVLNNQRQTDAMGT